MLKDSVRTFLQRSLAVFIVAVIFSGAIAPLAVRAQTFGDQGIEVYSYPFAAWTAKQEAKEGIKMSLVGSIFVYLVNLMTFAADRLAYDAAVMVASGGPANEPLYDDRPVQSFFKEYGAAVAGKSIDLLQADLAASDGAVGAIFSDFNLCQPSANVTVALNLGIKGVFDRPDPICDFKKVGSNWLGFMADIADEGSPNNKNKLIFTQLADAFDPQQNEFAVGIELQSSILNKALQDSFLNATVHIKEGGMQPVTDFITGNIKTPAKYIDQEFWDAQTGKKDANKETLKLVGQNTDALLQVGVHMGSVFTNTLLSEATKKIYSGLFDFGNHLSDPFGNIEDIATSNLFDARDAYRSFLTVTPLEITNYSILADFSSCPSGSARGLYNCVASNSFISAVGRADAGAPMTVAEAIEDGLIDGNWPLIPSTDLARNQDPFCYTYGFCHSNLVKLRKARIISIGWELAAESIYNSSAQAVTLNEVVNGFNDCNSNGEAGINHPWCKLIDPNWVLKYPDTQCRAMVNGQLLVTPASSDRQQECVDMPSCIAENDDGTCTGGYGYCVQEENVWRFRGESCPEQFASCLTFEGENKTVSYLETTVDLGACTADNAGCLWYDTQKADPEGDGTYDWQDITDVAQADAEPDAYTSRLYFTGEVEECDGTNGGCSQLYSRDDATRLNVLKNPSFEDDGNGDGIPDGWSPEGTPLVVDSSGDFSRSGLDAVSLTLASAVTQPGVAFSQGSFYTVSFYARQKVAGNTGFASASLYFATDDPATDVNLTGTSFVAGEATNCQISNGGIAAYGNGQDDLLVVGGTPTGVLFERFTCTFTSPRLSNPAANVTALVYLLGNVYMDDIQIEQGQDASAYHLGYSVQPSTLTVKVPPTYLGCQGDANDAPDCANYAQVCGENDVGCTAYTPTNGDPTVTGVATELDACPGICVGYDTFKQEPTLYEPAGVFPVHFIPASAEACTEAEVGCDEFTNLSTEALEYYTSLRSCVTPTQAEANVNSDKAAVYYTWEGSDLEGYQLKTWTLLESDTNVSTYIYADSRGEDSTPEFAPCSIWTATADGVICNDDLDLDGDLVKDWDLASCDEHDDIFTNPDCREFYDANGGIHYRQWSATVTVNEACAAYRKTEVVAVGDDLAAVQAAQLDNCRNSGGFFDTSLGICRYYGYSEESLGCSAGANGCRSYTGGRSRNSRVVLEDVLETGSLNNWDAANASDITLSNESLATGGHSIAATNQFSTFIYDYGKVCVDGGCEGGAQTLGGTCTVTAGDQFCGTLENELYQDKTYTLSFWAKGSGTLDAGFDLKASPGTPKVEVTFGAVNLTSGWQRFTLGPLDMNGADYPDFGDQTTLVFDPSSLAYIDNIVLREGEDNLTVIKDSWATPEICDQAPTGAASPQYYLGCQEYSTQDNERAYLKSFSRLCDEGKVGCEDFFMTHESESPYAEVFNATCSNPSGVAATSPTACHYRVNGAVFDVTSQYLCTIGLGQTGCDFNMDWFVAQVDLPSHITYGPSTVVVPADSDIFLVVNDAVTCSSAVAGCTEVGKVKWSQDRNSTTGADSVFLLNDPDNYDRILCSEGELFCAAWDTDNDGTFYFKDPAEQTCEYRTNVTVGGSEYDGWFRSGTDQFCYGTCSNSNNSCSSNADCGNGTCNTQDPSYLVNGDYSGVWRNGDDDYAGWVGECENQYSTCSEFQDPLDIDTNETYLLSDGEAYFYLNNDNLDENALPDSQRCDGQVSLKEGCALFNDTSKTSQGYNASATEIASRHADVLLGKTEFSLVDPIDCEVGDSSFVLANGSRVDLCAQRCVYDRGLVNDITIGEDRGTRLDEELGPPANAGLYDYDDLYIAGTSCYKVSDCGTIRSESGDEITAVDCATNVRVTRSAVNGTEERVTVPRLTNDTNTILKVNRDRQCSEWLSCAEDQASWDERTNSWKTVCTDIELCTEYSSIGGTTFCSAWKSDAPEIVLDEDVYTNRDISWYGQEYSGFAIPDLFPVQTLEQANISPPPGHCDLSLALKRDPTLQEDFDDHHGQACTNEVQCGGEEANLLTGTTGTDYCVVDDKDDYRLALVAGSCTGDFGASCSIGFCENTGAACSSTSDCGIDGGTCTVGHCQRVETGTQCASDSNCAGDQLCSGGVCVLPKLNLSIEAYNNNLANPDAACPNGQVFAEHVDLKIGSCIREQCVLTPDGKTFEVASSEGKICRGQPESNSPFSYDLVDRWLDPSAPAEGSNDKYKDWDDVPYDVRSGFESATFCAPGEDCSCTYTKVTYDSGVRYFDDDTYIDEKMGICTSGLANAKCEIDNDCDVDGVEGTCSAPVREDVLLGLEGYCLEKDTGLNINGDRDQGACLTWLPVDQLAGSTDLYAKFEEAGYFEDTFACTYVSPFVNLPMSQHPNFGEAGEEGDLACANFEMASGSGDVFDEPKLETCASNVTCPAGYWALMSMPHYQDGGFGTMNDACAVTNGQNDCGYVCIPEGATTYDANDDLQSCDYTSDYVLGLKDDFAVGDWNRGTNRQNVKVVAANVDGGNNQRDEDTLLYQRFDNLVNALKDCTLKGVKLTDEVAAEIFDMSSVGYDGNITDYEHLVLKGEFYPACEEAVRLVDNSTFVGYPFTDRLLGPNKETFPGINSPTPGMDLVYGSWPNPYGFSTTDPVRIQNNWPLVVSTCQNTNSKSLVQPTGTSPFNLCNQPGQSVYQEAGIGGSESIPPSLDVQTLTNPENSKARSFVSFTYDGSIFNEGASETSGAWSVSGNPFDVIKQIFAAVDIGGPTMDNKYIWNANEVEGDDWPRTNLEERRQYTAFGIDDLSMYASDVRADGNPPTVWSLKSDSCVGTVCEEGDPDSITVNDQNSGDLTATDFFRAYVKFYAAADANQLPIRRVIVDWGDQQDRTESMQGSSDAENMYKNHRGLDTGTDNPICNSGNEWGMTPESCDSNYFNYSHVYTCSTEILTGEACLPEVDGVIPNSPCWIDQGVGGVEDRACVFQPRVHVRDNWGWCTGDCNYDGDPGCYEGIYDTLQESDVSASECGYFVDRSAGSAIIDPWVYYDGTIIVDRQ